MSRYQNQRAPVSPEERRRQEMEELRDELLSREPGERAGPRFHSQELVELLLEESEALQSSAPESAVFWAERAWELAEALRNKRFLKSDAKARAARLKGNVLRLEGELEAAERAFAQGLGHLGDHAPERPWFCRSLALLRWAQDRLDECHSLLMHAAWLFGDQGREDEVAPCLSLAGLLWAETSKPAWGMPALYEARKMGGVPRHPWLALRCGFLLAADLAEAGALPEGRAVLGEAMSLYSRIPQEGETLVAFRLEGAARARLGELAESEHLLEGVRRKQLARRNVPEVALTSVTLAAVLASRGRGEEAGRLKEEIEGAGFEPDEGGTFAAEALDSFRIEMEEGARPWEGAARVAAELLRLCRRFHVRLEPVPFI